jgi:predicted metalloprotease
MRLEGQRASENVEDRRGMRVGPVIAGGGLGALILAVVMMFMGRDPQPFLEQAKGPREGPGGMGEAGLGSDRGCVVGPIQEGVQR